MSLSVIIITKNEQKVIGRCLDSVAWADEIVVVDSGSSDDTVAICKNYGAKIEIASDWRGFGPQKNRALALASGDWILSLDADEWVDAALRAEIQNIILNPAGKLAFSIPRRSSFCGRWMRHSGWWPDRVIRLFRRGHGQFSDAPVHEKLIVQGALGQLRNPILHEAIVDIEDALEKMNRYSSAGAQSMWGQNRRATLFGALWHGLWTFVRTYFIRAGFLDGKEGFMLAVSNAEGAYYRYVKLMLLAKNKGHQ
jgi:glycosyltransferase involved in cell wall biosynthesis